MKNIVLVKLIVGDAILIAKKIANGIQSLSAQNLSLMSWEKVASHKSRVLHDQHNFIFNFFQTDHPDMNVR